MNIHTRKPRIIKTWNAGRCMAGIRIVLIAVLLMSGCIIFVGCGYSGNDIVSVVQMEEDNSVDEETMENERDLNIIASGNELQDNKNDQKNMEKESPDVAMKNIDEEFYITEITDEIFARMEGKSYKADCTLPREDLKYLHVLHYDLNGEVQEGEMVVNTHIAEDVLEILRELYDSEYPIEKIRLVDEYNAEDELSMENNNSSSFNFRFISYTTTVSKHGLGLAVDINPLYNPYVKMVNGMQSVEPITAEEYLDRTADFPCKIDENDLCYQLFTEHGFEWGGHWQGSKDYQHFEVPSEKIREWYP